MEKIKVHFTLPQPKETPKNAPGCAKCGCKIPMVGGEWLWATKINENTAKLENIPFLTIEYSLGDLVEFDENFEILRIVEKVARTRHITYNGKGKKERIKTRYGKIRDKLLEHDIHCEGAFAGVASISVPVDITEKQLEDIVFGSGAILLADA
jgi:hypothetical protein